MIQLLPGGARHTFLYRPSNRSARTQYGVALRLIERDDQLTQLYRMFRHAVRGNGSVAVITGPQGTGKTALLRTFADQATAEGALVLGATGSSTEQDLPFGVIDQLVHPQLGANPTSTPGEFTRQGEIRRTWSDLLALSDQQPVLIWIDDAHHADDASASTLLYWARRITHRAIMLAVAEPGASHQANSGLCAELDRLPHACGVELPVLSAPGVAESLRDQLDESDARRLAADCLAMTGGNPSLLHALVNDVRASGRPRSEPPTPGDTFARAVTSYLRQCDRTVREVIRGVAILGDAASPARLRQLCGIDTRSVSHTLDALNDGGLFDSGAFRHPAAASTVLGDLSPEDRSDLHLTAAELLYQDGAEATVVARHLLATAQIRKPWAAPVLEEAASRALDRDQMEFAVACLKLASTLCDDEAHRAVIITRLALAEWRTDPLKAADYYPQLFTALRKGLLRGRQFSAVLASLLWYGRFDEVANAFKGVTDHTFPVDSEMAAELHEARDQLSHTYPTVLRRIGVKPWDGIPAAPAVMTLTAGVNAMLATVMTHGDDQETTTRAEQMLTDVRLDDTTLETVKVALVTLISAGHIWRAAAWCDHFLAEATRRQAPTWRALLCAIKADIVLRQGNPRSARKYARSALAHIRPSAWGVAVASPLASMVLAATRMGRLEEAARELRRPVPEAAFHTRFGLYYLHARGHYFLAAGGVDAALREFMFCGELMDSWGIDIPGLVAWRVAAAEAYLRIGDLDRARELAVDELDRSGVPATRTNGMALRLLAVAGEPSRRGPLLRQAAACLRAAGDRYELARALVDLAEWYQTEGDHDKSQATAERAWKLAKACHAEPVTRALQAAHPRMDFPSSAVENSVPTQRGHEHQVLTAAELRVAGLAAVGHTNRQIAGQLSITISTVEQHLTSVYRKLRVPGRVGLSRVAVLSVNTSPVD